MTGGHYLGTVKSRRYVGAALLISVLACSSLCSLHALSAADPILSKLIFVLVGFFGAVVGNVTAIGGGLVFIPILVFGYQIPAIAALKTSIITQAFGMTSGAIAWNRKGKVPWAQVPLAIPGLLIGSSISSLLIHPSPTLVKGLFGPVSIVLGILILITTFHRRKVKRSWNLQAKIALCISSTIGGLLTGWVAIGEGEIVAATLMILFGFNAEESIALGVVLLSINSIYLAILHLVFLGGVPWEIAAFTIPGCIVGAQLAPLVARLVNELLLKSVFACIAILDGLLFTIQFLIQTTH